MASARNQDQERISAKVEESSVAASMQDELGQRCLQGQRKRCEASIFRVFSGRREANVDAFDPRVISLGPYHHGHPRLKAMEDLKWRYLHKLIARNPDKGLSDYFNTIKSSIDRARKCYSEDVNVDDDHFVRLLLLDGSFIVEFLLVRWEKKREKKLDGDEEPFDLIDGSFNTSLPHIAWDILKLENQVPFFVLQIIYRLVNRREGGQELTAPSITDLVFDFVVAHNRYFVKEQMIEKPSSEEINHLLHFYHLCFFAGRGKRYKGRPPISIPTVRELREAGVKLKKKDTGGFLEVTFSRGLMEMTTLPIDDDTLTILHNLVAFEQCCPQVGVYVIGYCVFLDCLIDTSHDVLLLRQIGIIEHALGSDKELAQMVNRLGHDVLRELPDPLGGLFTNVNEYCQSHWPRWRATLMHDYFSNPWAIISFIAAVILLTVAGLQTVFSMLSYIRPPPQK